MNLVDSIRSLIRANLQDRDQVIDLAAEYAEECADLNSRMRQVVELLQRGLVSEATELADTSPPIMERFAELDFPELNEWFSLLLGFDLDPPPRLLSDLAEEIDQAYAEKDSLADLMKMQRLLALRRAPLKSRLQVLREIVQQTPDNPLWTEDLKALEEARLKEITKEAQMAKNDKNTFLVDSLLIELNQEWTISVPSQLIDSVFETKSNFEIQIARENLAQINEQLNRCLSEFDFDKAFGLREHWHAAEPEAQLDANHPLRAEVAEVFRWLNEVEREAEVESQFQSALRNLDAAFDSDMPLEGIEKLYYAVHQFDREIPEVTESRLLSIRNKHQLNAKRKFMATVLISGLAIVLAGAAIFYLITSIQYSGKKSDALNSIRVAIEEKDWNRAAEIYSSLSKKLSNEPAIMELGQQALGKQKEENGRAQIFEAMLAQLKKAELDPPPFTLIDQVSELATTDSEKQAVQLVRNDVDSHQQELLKNRNEHFLVDSKKVTDQLSKLESSFNDQDPLATSKELDQISEQLKDLKRKNTGTRHGIAIVSRSLIDQLPSLEIRCQNLVDRLEEIEKENRWLSQMKTVVGDEVAYADQLSTFVNDNPSSSFNADFSLVTDELVFGSKWNNVHRFSTDSVLTKGGQVTKAKAKSLLDELEKIQDDFGAHPYFDEVFETKTKLEKIVASDSSRQLRSLQSVLEWYPMKNLWLMKDSLGRRIYSPLEPKVSNGKTSNTLYFESVPTRASDKTNKRSFENIVAVMKAPHVELVTKISAQIKDAEDPNLALINAIKEAVKKVSSEEQPDVIVRAFLLKALFSAAIEVNPQNSKVLKEWVDFLDGVGLDQFRKGEPGDWVGVSNSRAQDLRKILLDYFTENLADLDYDALKTNAMIVNRIDKVSVVPEVQWVGFLLRSPSGKWQVHLKRTILEGTKLYCIIQNGVSVNLNPVGVYDSSSELSLTSSRSGRPVYVMKE